MWKLLTTMRYCAMEGVINYVIQSCPPINTGHAACLSFILTCFFSAVLCIVYILIYVAGMLIKTVGHILWKRRVQYLNNRTDPKYII
jgi:hypothetical protein